MRGSRFNPLITIQGANAGDNLGFSMASAGDVNKDGYDDVIIGAYQASPGGRDGAGEVYVIYGSKKLSNLDLSSILSTEEGFNVFGHNGGDGLGVSVTSAGDINNDGYDDIIIGALRADPGGRENAGKAYVIYGNTTLSDIDLSVTDTSSSSYFSPDKGFMVLGTNSFDQLGISVSSAGDINNDSYDDIIIGAESANPGGRVRAGEAYVIYGNTTLSDIDLSITDTTSPNYFDFTKGFKVLGDQNDDRLGRSVSKVGDVNNDSYDDIIIGAYQATPGGRFRAGEAYVIYGNTTLSDIDLSITDTTSPSYFSFNKGFSVLGDNNLDGLGISVSDAGDVNNDGYNDIIVGAYQADPGGRSAAGEAYVIYGNTTLSDIDLSITDTTLPSYFSFNKGFSVLGDSPIDLLGFSVSGARDVNNDGYDDIIIGAFTASPGGRTQAGEAYVIYGNATLSDIDLSVTDTTAPNYFSSDKGFSVLGGRLGDQLGIAVNSIGDVNNDGYDDVIIGALNADPGGRTDAGEAYVISGAVSFTTDSTTITQNLANQDIMSEDITIDSSLNSLTMRNSNIISYGSDIDLAELSNITISDSNIGVYGYSDILDISATARVFDLSQAVTAQDINFSRAVIYCSNSTFIVNDGDIDLSNAAELIFNDGVEMQVSLANTISLPSGFRISGPMPTFSVTPIYATENGAYQITQNIEYSATATGNITSDINSLMISANLTSTEGIIDLRTSSSLACLSNPTISATTTSVIIVPVGTTGCIYADNSILYLGGDFTIENAIVNADLQYTDEITTANLPTLTVNNDIRSYDGDIDLSNAVELIFNDNVEVEVSSANTITLPPMANISGNATYMGNVEYRSRGNTGGGGSDNGGSGSGSSGGNAEDSGSSGGTIAGAVIGSLAAIALIGFGFYRWHETTNNADVKDAGAASEIDMEEGADIAGVNNGLYDEV